MPVAAAFIRIFSALLLGIPIVLAFTYYLVATAADATLLDPDFVASSIQRSGYYDRVYSEVLLRPEFSDWTGSFIGGFEVAGDERAQLLEDLAPTSYLQEEAERNITALLLHLTGSRDDLELYIDLNTPLLNSGPATLEFVDQRIEELESVAVSSPEELTTEVVTFLRTLNAGTLPIHAPSADAITVERRIQAYQEALETIEGDGAVSSQAMGSLRQSESEALALIGQDKMREALKLSGRSVTEARIEQARTFILDRSNAVHRLNLVDQFAEANNRTPTQIRRDARILGLILRAATSSIAQWVGLSIAVLCVLGIALLFIPYWKHVIFWPSVILLLSGMLLLLTAFGTTLETSYWASVLCKGRDLSHCTLTLDVLREVAVGVRSGLVDGALKILVIGSIGLILAFVVSRMFRHKTS